MLKKNILLVITALLLNCIAFGEKNFEPDNNFKNTVNAPKHRVIADFDGDGKTDISVYRPSDGNWYIWRSSDNSYQVTHFGAYRDSIAPGDFDGDSKTDFVIRRNSVWYILNSSDSTIRYEYFGNGFEYQAVGDYDGDGKDDVAVFRGENGTWYIKRSSDGFVYQIQFGLWDFPVPADYDGDGKTDIAVSRLSDNPDEPDFYILRSSDSSVGMYSWGTSNPNDRPVIGDYDGDGQADITVYRRDEENWYILKSSGGYSVEHLGAFGVHPVRGDYDGDGKDDIAVYNPFEGNWYIKNSSTNNIRVQNFGLIDDAPVPLIQNP